MHRWATFAPERSPMPVLPLLKRAALGIAVATTLAGAFYAGAAYAADPRLDQASDNITKAIALLQAAENPEGKPPFGGHVARAIERLQKAQEEIAKAKQFADQPPPPPKPKGPHHEH
jgi:hypothetical protein